MRLNKQMDSGTSNLFGFEFPETGLALSAPGVPPSPWSTGIIDLAGNGKLILEAQPLRGKILVSKNLEPGWKNRVPKREASALLRTVTASTMIARTRL